MTATLMNDIIPQNETQRLEVLNRYKSLYASPEEAFNNIVRIMADVFNVPIALISFVDQDRVFFKGNVGMPGVKYTDRNASLCSFAILSSEPTIFDKPLEEPCLLANPLVHGDFGLRFYAGAPLTTADGYHIGSVCVVDKKERSFSQAQQDMLARFASLVMHEIELRLAGLKQGETEQQLKAANEELQFVTDVVPQLVWAADAGGYAYFFNQGWLQYTGLTLEDLKGDGWTQALHPDDREQTHHAWQEAVETGHLYETEYRLNRHDNVYRWFLARGVPMKDGHGNISKWYGTTTDIEDQKQEEVLELERSAERLRAVFDAAQSGMFTFAPVRDKTGTITDFRFVITNPAFAAYVGQTPEVLNGELGSTWFPGYLHNGVFDMYKKTYLTGEQQRIDIHYNVDGHDIYLDLQSMKVGDEVLVTFHDYTALKQAQLQLEKYIEELKRSNTNLEEFAYAASHDMKEPVRKVRFFADRLKQQLKDQLNGEQSSLFSRMEHAAQRMGLLIDDLLTYSHVSRGASHLETVDLNHKVQVVLEDLELEIDQRGATVTTDHLPVITGNKRQVQQLFQNLIGNALKYCRPDVPAEVHISATQVYGHQTPAALNGPDSQKPYHLIAIQDNGIGFDPEDAERIFNVFTRLHGNAEYKGSGVGLSIARKVVENHKGFIWAESEPGAGATFKVLLPAG